MLTLNLPPYTFSIKKENGKQYIFDNQRKKFVALTPEEWVRVNFVRFLTEQKHFPPSRVAVEYTLKIGSLQRRCDAAVFDRAGKPQIVVELKAPHIAINQQVFDQIAVYNSKLKVNFFIVSNGLQHYCCKVDTENSRYDFLPEIPDYQFFEMY